LAVTHWSEAKILTEELVHFVPTFDRMRGRELGIFGKIVDQLGRENPGAIPVTNKCCYFSSLGLNRLTPPGR
jgi:hypothetical protein